MKAKTLVLTLLLLCFGIAAHATPIVYSVSGTATGTLGGSTFTNQLLTIAFAGDTGNVTGGSGFYTNETGTGTVLLNGITVATFTEALRFFDNQTFSPTAAAGIGDAQGSIFDTLNSAFASYTGSTAIGPLSGSAFIRPDLFFSTTAGQLNISSVSGDSTFLATTTAATPEPSSFLLLATGVLGTATAMRRKLAGLR